MDINEIYEKFDKIGAFTFATIEDGRPRTRIAHLFGYDEEGLYFRTMICKPFYTQLKKTGMVALGGMYPNSSTTHNEEGMPEWEPGYTINLTGDVREISLELLKEKAVKNSMFDLGVKDIERYPAMTTFCMYRGSGEVYDFDFEMKNRDHKLLRTPLSFGGMVIPFRGVRITEECVGCGDCIKTCTFKAIYQDGDKFKINHEKCDVCGDCTITCLVDAVEAVSG